MATRSKKADSAAATHADTKEAAAVQSAGSIAAVQIPAPGGLSFSTEPNSPFSDGYSIAGEEAALAEFMAGEMDESDPLYDRYIELEDRKDRLERMQAEFKSRKGAGALVTRDEVRGMDELGTLVDEDVDQMTIHTKEAYDFMKAGVMLLDLVPEGQEQGELELDGDAEVSERLMGAVDAINDRYGKGAIRVASAGVQVKKREWEMRQELRTPRYTTRWDEVPVART